MKKKTATKIMSYLLTTAMIVGGLGLSPLATVEVQAAEKKNINLNVGNDIEGISGTSVNTDDAATIYYGAYPSVTGVAGNPGDPIAWRVIGYNGEGVAQTSESGTATLLAADVVIHGQIFSDTNSNNYSGSNLQTQINSIASGLTSTEESTVLKRTLAVCNDSSRGPNGSEDHSEHNCKGITGVPVIDAVMWPLSTAEANAIGNNNLRETTGSSTWWWLRSPGIVGHHAAHVVCDNGDVPSGGIDVFNGGGARPAFHLNLSSVLFSSAAGGMKSEFGFVKDNKVPNNKWKLTLKDESGTFLYERVDNNAPEANKEIKIDVKEISGPYDNITAMVLDNDNTVLGYGKISDASTGIKTFTIPTGMTGGTQIKFFAEKWNGSNETDYAREGGTATTSRSSHTHHFEWITTKEPTVTQDGEEEYRCSCGKVEARKSIPANVFYIKDLNRQIMEAAENGRIEYDAGWNSCISDYNLKKVADRPDVTIIITFEYQKKKYRLTIPAGTDVTTLLQDTEQIYGYFGLANLLGLEVEEIVETK